MFSQMEAADNNDEIDALASEALDFTEHFILPWLPKYCNQVEERCHTELWKDFLELTTAVLSDIREMLNAQDDVRQSM